MWRLNNLYWIIGKDPDTGKQGRMKFRLNWAQSDFINNIWFLSIILKARQLGFTTLVCILFLDTALFRPDTRCGIIAHTLDDSEEFFSNKIKYAYDNLPPWIREVMNAPSKSAKKLVLANNSSVRVGTSLRGGTFDLLHISEFGKICAQMPKKAREIVTGALNTVHVGSFVFIESTAEGREGAFYKLCTEARNRLIRGLKPNKMQYKFFFFPWWKHPDYVIHEPVPIPQDLKEYFEELESKGIRLTDKQKWWYVSKRETQEDDMMREFPSTPDEAFAASISGAYYGRQMTNIRKRKRLGSVPYDPLYPVNVFWDIGFGDHMALWFHQRIGKTNRLVHYFQANGEGLEYFVDYLQKLPYIYAKQFMPHDAAHGSAQTGKTFVEYAQSLGLRNIETVKRPRNGEELLQQIQAVRFFLNTCWIDEEECSDGVKCLDNYRKEWDANIGAFKKTPLHDWASHGADSLRTGAVGFKEHVEVEKADLLPEYAPDM